VTVLVLDFDGTMTDAEIEGRPFVDGYLEDLAALVGRGAGDAEIAAIAAEVDAEIAASPDRYPFLWMGRPVAPATVDPYLRMVPTAHRILDKFGALASATDRARLLGTVLYKYNYAKTLGHPAFRPGAGEMLRALAGRDAYIVTNSDTHAVAGKIAALDREVSGVAWLTSRVRGHARKFDVDDTWSGAPAELAVTGLDRSVLLRRRMYHDILRALLDDHGATFAELVVVGDIFELDLAMPLALGARVGLVAGAQTPPHEVAYVASHPRGRVLRALDEVREFAYPAGR
jgi:phosphoglycolate phosphatase-like HAD superfamily hydrolase